MAEENTTILCDQRRVESEWGEGVRILIVGNSLVVVVNELALHVAGEGVRYYSALKALRRRPGEYKLARQRRIVSVLSVSFCVK